MNAFNRTLRKNPVKTPTKQALQKCERFCKNDYVAEMNNVFKKTAKNHNQPYIPPTKQDNEFTYNTCKKSFCNPSCDGYDFFGDKIKQAEFKTKLKNGFHKTYDTNTIENLQKKGALSGCVNVTDYNVRHKGGSTRSRTRSKSRTYDPVKQKYVFTNKYRRQAEKQKSNTRKLPITQSVTKWRKKYAPNQFVGIGLQATNHTRRTKAAPAAFRGSKYRAIFDQFNKYRT